MKKILKVVCKEALLLTNVPKVLSAFDAKEMIRRLGFYDRYKNSEGKGLGNKYNLREINNNNVVLDEATGLMWQQSGSENYMRYKKAEKWISELNQKSFASFSDWRLHTLEEAISLIEPESKVGLYINLIFNNKQSWIWAVDRVKDAGASGRRVINFNGGSCGPSGIVDITYVRAVRSGQSSQE